MSYSTDESQSLAAARTVRLNNARSCYLFQPALLSRLNELSCKKLWMSDPEKFNDPLDLRLRIEDQTYRGPFGDEVRLCEAMRVLIHNNSQVASHWFYNERLLDVVRRWTQGELAISVLEFEIQDRFMEFGVACFTPVWNHALMWSHYAERHKGYCIEYSVREMDLVQKNQGLVASFPVQYSSSLPKLCITEALFSPHQTLGRMLATKSAEWAYEREWRLVHLEKKGMSIDMPVGIEISALIAGQKAAQPLLEKLVKKAISLKVPAYKIRLTQGYELTMELL